MDSEYVENRHRQSGLSAAERGGAVFQEFVHAAKTGNVDWNAEGPRYMIRIMIEAIEAAVADAENPTTTTLPATTQLVNTIYEHVKDDAAAADIVRVVARERTALLTQVARLEAENHKMRNTLQATTACAEELLQLSQAS